MAYYFLYIYSLISYAIFFYQEPKMCIFPYVGIRATEILKSKSVRSTDDVIGTCVRQSQIVTKTNDSSFSSKSVSEIDYFSNTL